MRAPPSVGPLTSSACRDPCRRPFPGRRTVEPVADGKASFESPRVSYHHLCRIDGLVLALIGRNLKSLGNLVDSVQDMSDCRFQSNSTGGYEPDGMRQVLHRADVRKQISQTSFTK